MAAALLAKMTASFHSRLLFFSFQTFCFAGETGRSKLDARKTNVQRLKKLVKKRYRNGVYTAWKKKGEKKKSGKEIANLKSVCFERLLLYVCSKPSASSVTWAYSPEKMKPTSPNFATISSRTKWGKVDKWLFTCDYFCFCFFFKTFPLWCRYLSSSVRVNGKMSPKQCDSFERRMQRFYGWRRRPQYWSAFVRRCF